MEFEWKLNQLGPFPEGIHNTITNLCTALVIQEADASQAPANTATPTTTTTTLATPNKNPTTLSTWMEEDLNTIEKIDAQLACMELNWVETQSGPFPERV